MSGQPIQFEFRTGLKSGRDEIHAGSFLRNRRIAFDAALAHDPREFARILVHELFHFTWLRLGNPRRRSYEELVAAEVRSRVRGELGWSAEWRKKALLPGDLECRGRRWREYLCESFCDTAAFLYSGVASHPEYTLALRSRGARRLWFEGSGLAKRISI
ncbi:MAG: hypothetical protein U0Q18_21965 [Bryobacteraceae bacterium]